MSKIILVNGSPNQHGCTDASLNIIAAELNKQGIETDIFWIGNKPIAGCIGCRYCATHGKCCFDDKVNEFSKIASDYDGFVFGTPVHFAGIASSMKAFLDRTFFSDNLSGQNKFIHKTAATIVSTRRAGATETLDQMNKYPLYAEMLLVGSRYWNLIHGMKAEEILQDKEGVQTMEVLGMNLAWATKCVEAGKSQGIEPHQPLKRVSTNFVR